MIISFQPLTIFVENLSQIPEKAVIRICLYVGGTPEFIYTKVLIKG